MTDHIDTTSPVPIPRIILFTVWVRTHPFRTLVWFFAAVLFLQIAFLPWFEVASLKTSNPGETAFMRADRERAEEAKKSFRKRQQWIPFGRISRTLVDAVVVAEDGTFWSHGGFDWFEFRESMERNWKEKRAARGASTITQQLVKNLYLSASKNPLRKVKEWILTWYIEQRLGKTRILEIYLNVIELGNGVYGVEAASQLYFGKSAGQISRDEAVRLAAIIPSPKRHRADEGSRYVERRAGIILRRMDARRMVERAVTQAAKDSVQASVAAERDSVEDEPTQDPLE